MDAVDKLRVDGVFDQLAKLDPELCSKLEFWIKLSAAKVSEAESGRKTNTARISPAKRFIHNIMDASSLLVKQDC